jgi:hypothetical protein
MTCAVLANSYSLAARFPQVDENPIQQMNSSRLLATQPASGRLAVTIAGFE